MGVLALWLLAVLAGGVAHIFAWRAVIRDGRHAHPVAGGIVALGIGTFWAYAIRPQEPFHLIATMLVTLAPPMTALDPVWDRHGDLRPILIAAAAAGAAGLLAWRALPRALRLVGPLALAAVAAIATAEMRSRGAMCTAALASGRDGIARRPIWSSWTIAPQEFGFDLHAGWRDGTRLWAWSYAAQAFHEVPERVRGNVDLPRGRLSCT